MVPHVGNKGGFTDGAELIFRSGGKLQGYHGDMNRETFDKWFSENRRKSKNSEDLCMYVSHNINFSYRPPYLLIFQE